MKVLTYKELLEILNTLNEYQLNQPVNVDRSELPLISINGIWIVSEDHINPKGDGAEPVSSYKDHPDYKAIIRDEPIVLKMGTILLLGAN